MSKIRPLQRSFSSGEITPRFFSRPELPFYAQAAKLIQNWIITHQGTLLKRNGSELIAEISTTLTYGRIFNFRVEASEAFTVLVTVDEITLYSLQGIVSQSNLVINPGFDINLDSWNVNLTKTDASPLDIEPSIIAITGAVSIDSGNAAFIDRGPFGVNEVVIIKPCDSELTQELTGIAAADLHTLKITIVPGSFSAFGNLLDYLSIGTTEGANDISFTIDPADSSKISFTPGVTSFWISYKLAWDDSVFPSIACPNPPTNGGQAVFCGEVGLSAKVKIDSIVIENTITTAGPVTFSSPWTEQEIRELQLEKAPGLNTLYFAVRSTTVTYKLTYSPSTETWTFGVVTYSNPPATWATDGYPGSITFHKGRMELAGSLRHPVTAWLSKTGEDNFEDFDFGTALDDEALELPLARDSIIQWTQGGKTLILGTDVSEHTLIGAEDFGPITPTNVDGPQQSSYGSARIHGRWLSDKVVYVSNDQRRLYAMQYNRRARQQLSEDLTYKAEHITEGLVQELKVGQDPDEHIWCALENGELVGCTLQPEAETIGWYRYDTTFGIIKSITIIRQHGISILWILVVRNGKLYLEREGTEYMDAYITREYVNATVIVDGLGHLEGLSVQVKSNGAYAGIYAVNSGKLTVNDQFKATSFQVGIPIKSTVITLPVDLISQTETIATKLLRWSRIYVRLAGLRPDINNIKSPDRLVSTPMDTPELEAENLDITGSLGRDKDGSITLTQNLPFSTEIISLFGELQQEGF